METKNPYNEFWISEISRFLKGELTYFQEQELHDWIDKDEKNALVYKEIRNSWLAAITFDSEMDGTDKLWEQLVQRADHTEKRTKAGRSSIFLKVAGIAALIAVAFISGMLVSKVLPQKNAISADDLTEVITPMGAKSQCILPDGTKVWLNAGSRLTYKKSFNEKERVVNLTGEAFFQVKTNKEKPFIVQTSKLSVKALGTTFNVKAYAEDKQVTATLVEGIILVEGKGADSKSFSIKLKPRQSITLKESETIDKQNLTEHKNPENSKSIEIAPLVEVQEVSNTEKYTSWKDSLWQIEAENLEDLAIMISRRFNVKIYNESAGLKDYRFTGTIRNETLEQVLNILRYTTPLKYKVGKGEVWWTLDSRLKEDYSKVLKNKH